MKKLFTLIALICALAPAIHGMNAQLPTDRQQQYNNLTELIKSADVNAFKTAFDALTLSTRSITALQKKVAESKSTITAELKAMGDKTKNWSKIAEGGLATFLSSWAGLSVPATIHFFNTEKINPIVLLLALPACVFSALGIVSLQKTCAMDDIKEINHIFRKSFFATNILANLCIAYKGLPYGIKTFKAGWNYKEHLQNMLANIDAIDAHITQAKA